MDYGDVLARRIKSPAAKGAPMEFWTWGGLRALFRDDQPGLELLPAGALPAVPKQGRVVIFARESGVGTGKYQICAMGPGGNFQILMTEP